ncbi:hypothetical protein CEXT_658841 [Caerostris extrusa]|uniref:RNase H type-1 domain-containing protein n=1 Tax=Caerostris extrusa TaxID=172846 RepID=A0AAV4NGP7_CAEEX|nr:hypothetical protein CEXT_658841 [Caerostris extrusa]
MANAFFNSVDWGFPHSPHPETQDQVVPSFLPPNKTSSYRTKHFLSWTWKASLPWTLPETEFKITWRVFDNDVRGFAIYPDGSKLNGHTGCALVVFIDGHEDEHLLCKLNPEASVFIAEMKAIEMAVNYIVSRGMSNATIISDSRSALLALGNPLNN